MVLGNRSSGSDARKMTLFDDVLVARDLNVNRNLNTGSLKIGKWLLQDIGDELQLTRADGKPNNRIRFRLAPDLIDVNTTNGTYDRWLGMRWQTVPSDSVIRSI
jgi:hypothetical protein